MPDIGASVGTGATNQPTDVALVEALLCVVRTANGQPYMSSYDGAFATATGNAITAFQQDNGIVPRPGARNAAGAAQAPAAPPGTVTDTAGVMNVGGPTIAKLNASLPTAYQSLNIIPNTLTVYFESSAALAARSAAQIRADGTLDSGFRGNVAALVDAMYADYKLALGVPRMCGLRTFAEQYTEATTVVGTSKSGQPLYHSNAGPGESNHNYGMAVDLGFLNFKYLGPTGVAVSDDPWLEGMRKKYNAKFLAFWAARDGLITPNSLTLYNTTLKDDYIHLQNFNDSGIDMRNSLALLLNTVGSMKWSVSGQIYSCDFGLGKAFYPVGKSENIWDQTSTVTAATLTTAWKAAGKTTQAKQQDVTDMKQWLREEFDRAEANRSQWVAVP